MSLELADPTRNGAEPLKIWNCTNCRRRKVRCDRRHPCAPCTRNKIECIFPVSGRIPRRSRDANHPHHPAQKQAELAGRLRRLEAMVGGLSSQVENATMANQSSHTFESSESTTSTTSNESVWLGSEIANGTSELPRASGDAGLLQIASNGDLVVGKGFWSVFCKEVEEIFEAVQGHTVIHFEEDSNTSGISPHTGFYNFLLRSTSATRQTENIQPLPSQIPFLWQTYLDNVDPFIKVLHFPTMTKTIREIRGNYQNLSPSMQTLVLAISLAAIMSLEDEEVHANFSIDKDQLVARYRLGTELALQQANFPNYHDITVLQALTIYLTVLQNTGEARSAWFQAGVLVRVALFMKLHRDGPHSANMTTFETEMRRRLWWQVCFIDSRSEGLEVTEYKLSESMFDTKVPMNTNDLDIDPRASNPPVIKEGWTDMTIFLIRCEIWKLSRRLQSIKGASCPSEIRKNLELLFQQSQARIEETYLKHLSPDEPIHSFVATSARLFLSQVGLILRTRHHATKAVPPPDASQSDKVFMSSLSIIDYHYALQNEPGWSGWSWQIQSRQPPWHALRVVLSQLRTRVWGSICEQAWSSAKRSLDSLPEVARHDPRYQQLLMLTSEVQKRGTENPRQDSESFTNIQADQTASDLSTPLARVGISGSVSSWTPQESFLGATDDSSNHSFGENVGAEMDWQVWDEIAGDLEFWDMGGL